MKNKNLRALAVILVAVVIAFAVAYAGGQTGPVVRGWPLLVVCAALSFGIQWAAFVPAFALKTERFYDLAGSLTYLALLACAARFGPPRSMADTLLLLMCGLWALRLGTFLFMRIHKDGADKRFTHIKTQFGRFAVSWTLQGLWVFFTLCPVLIVVASPAWHHTTAWTVVGAGLWAVGFGIEILADWQKRQFRANPQNRGRFIQTGLWARSRHPNYVGEMLLWFGVFIMCVPMLQGWQWVSVVSPLFIVLLLTRVSGVPLLEASADARWGAESAYQAYKAKTPILWPWGKTG